MRSVPAALMSADVAHVALQEVTRDGDVQEAMAVEDRTSADVARVALREVTRGGAAQQAVAVGAQLGEH
eukprot:11906352-Alexandrium_andersonii.AAC.1